MKWINAIGLVLQFTSFWLAAPELLGQNTLRRFEGGLKRFITLLPLALIWIIILAYGLTFSILGIMKGLEGGKTGRMDYSFFIPLIICTCLYFIFIFFNKKIRYYLDTKLSQPLTQRLINNNETRKNLLIVGALIFTAGFFMQLIVILLGE
jgi:hypothetical protein